MLKKHKFFINKQNTRKKITNIITDTSDRKKISKLDKFHKEQYGKLHGGGEN